MASSGARDAKRNRRRLPGAKRLCGAKTHPGAVSISSRADPAKALVMKSIRQIVANGHGQWSVLDDGNIQLRFRTGEMFLLGETVIVRLA